MIIKIKHLENEGFLAKKIHSMIQISYKLTKMGTKIDGEHIGGVYIILMNYSIWKTRAKIPKRLRKREKPLKNKSKFKYAKNLN